MSHFKTCKQCENNYVTLAPSSRICDKCKEKNKIKRAKERERIKKIKR